jgi:gamma-glutamylaminecyclotransferase
MIKVFVYGTLKAGYGNNRLLDNESSDLIGKAVLLTPAILACNGSFPYLSLIGTSSRKGWVLGEVYQVSEEVMRTLDSLEGYPDFYNRSEMDCLIIEDAPKIVKCWVYHVDLSSDAYVTQPGLSWVEPDETTSILKWSRHRNTRS